MVPRKLKPGDHIRIVSPSRSMAMISEEVQQIAKARLASIGLTVSYSKNCSECDQFTSSTIESRVSDLHDALLDPQVNGILTTIGGYNSNQILNYLDYDLIKANPKPFCGFSDITVLSNAIHAKTGLITYSGPHFCSFGMRKGFEYSLEYFKSCLMAAESFQVAPAPSWSDDPWFSNQDNREFIPSNGYLIINPGNATGKIIGGNISSFALLNGTPFMPDLRGSILFLEAYFESYGEIFDRLLQAIILQPSFKEAKGLVIGRFQKKSAIDDEKLKAIIASKKELEDIPIIANASFGHTTPIFTFPIGGEATLSVQNQTAQLSILTH